MDALGTFGEVSPVGLFHADEKGRWTYVNARWCELTGLSPAEAMGAGWLSAIHPEDRVRVGREWEKAAREGRPFSLKYRYRRRDGSVVWILGEARLAHDAAGRPLGYAGSATDVTELCALGDALLRGRAEVEAVLIARTQKLFHMALAMEASADAIIIAGVEGKIASWNKAAEEMLGWTAGEMIGQTGERLVPEELRQAAQAVHNRVWKGDRVAPVETIRRICNGALIEVVLTAFPLRDAGSKVVGICTVLRDETDLKRAQRRLQRLSRRLLEAQDEERRRLARELHDSAAQTVIALAMNLARLARPDEFRGAATRDTVLQTCLDLAAAATRELRTTVYVLHPPLLDARGLGPALEWFRGGFQDRSGIAVALEIDPDLQRLSARVELALFRVAQESLSNVHRHSGSATATLRLSREGRDWVLQVQDAGHGVAPGAGFEEGIGISGMRERMAELGGTFDLQSTAAGTTVTARLPITQSDPIPTPSPLS